jgi:hypothetical protein
LIIPGIKRIHGGVSITTPEEAQPTRIEKEMDERAGPIEGSALDPDLPDLPKR